MNAENKCEICEKVYITKQKLKKHTTYSHNNIGKVYCCSICTLFFQTQRTLKVHTIAIHARQKNNNKCESCGKSFS